MAVCRLCLARRRVRHPIFDSNAELLAKIHACLPLQLSQTDSLPKKICESCILKINDVYDYCNKVKNAEKELLSNSLLLASSIDCENTISDDENDDCYSKLSPSRESSNNEKAVQDIKFKRRNEILIIKEEPPENDLSPAISNNLQIKNINTVINLIKHSKFSSKYTQTDLCEVLHVENQPEDIRNKSCEVDRKIQIKEEFSECLSDNLSESTAEYQTVDVNQYSSEDDLTLNNVIKIPPIKVKIKREYSDSLSIKNKKSKKRKKQPDITLPEKKSRGRPKGSLNKNRIHKTIEKKSKKQLKLIDNCDLLIKSENMDLEYGDNLNENGFNEVQENAEKSDDSKLWQCLTCFIYEKSRADLLQHYKDHVENPAKIQLNTNIKNELIVKEEVKMETDDAKNEIGATTNNQPYMIVQSKEFSDDPAYQCLKCYKLFINKRAVIRHLVCHDDSRPYPCNICGRAYKRAYEILLHGRAHSGVKTLFCRYELCNYSTVYRGALLSHHKRHEPDYKYTCEVCNKGFDVLTWFTEHQNVHTGDKPFSCDLCGKSFIYSRYLSSHRKSVHPETNVRKLLHRCEECNAEFPYRKKLQRHIAHAHGGENALHVLCDICGKRLSSKEHLKFHRRIHTGEKPHVCKTCNKGFVKKCNLKLHERIHSGERPHVCSHCGKAFSQRSTLVIHERYHSGARPYQCNICNKAFVAKGLLSMHQKTCV